MLRARDAALKELIDEFEAHPDGEYTVSDLEAAAEAYELLFRFDRAKAVAHAALEKNPDSEAAHLTLIRSLLNQKRTDEARDLVVGMESRGFQPTTMARVHGMLSTSYRVRKNWSAVAAHANEAIRARLRAFEDDPRQARHLAEWFRMLREASNGSGDDAAALDARLVEYEKILSAYTSDAPGRRTDAAFVKESIARHLLAECAVARQHAERPPADAFAEWLEYLARAWEDAVATPVLIEDELMIALDRVRQVTATRDGAAASLMSALEHVDRIATSKVELSPEQTRIARIQSMARKLLDERVRPPDEKP